MRFFLPLLILSLVFFADARAQEDAPGIDPALKEYSNVPEGLLLPKIFYVAPEKDKGAPATPENESTMTIEDINAQYKQGNYSLILRQLAFLAKNGHHSAEELLGVMYHNGQGVEKDPKEALFWLGKAAEAGRPLAAHHLAIMSFAGEGVEADPAKALMWLHIAILHYPDGPDKKRAQEDRDNIDAQTNRHDKIRAQSLAREWLNLRGEGHLLDLQ